MWQLSASTTETKRWQASHVTLRINDAAGKGCDPVSSSGSVTREPFVCSPGHLATASFLGRSC